jgi:hypothetical protein
VCDDIKLMALLLLPVVLRDLFKDAYVFSEDSYFIFFPVLSCFRPYFGTRVQGGVGGFQAAALGRRLRRGLKGTVDISRYQGNP